MAQGPFSSDDIDADIAALMGVEPAKPAGPPDLFGKGEQDNPEFDALFGDLDLSADAKDKGPGGVDLTKRGFKPLAKLEDDPPNSFFSDPNYYKLAMGNGGEEATSFHQVLTRYSQTQDPKDKSVIRQKLVPAYWNLIRRFSLQCAGRDFAVPKQLSMRFGALLPNFLSPEQRQLLERVVYKNETGEPVHYVDEWIKMVALGQVKSSATDEAKTSRGDDKARMQNLMSKSQGKRDSAEGILKAKVDERHQLEQQAQQRLASACQHDSQPGMLHVLAPYTDAQKKTFSELLDTFRQLAQADRDLQRAIDDFEEAEKEIKSISDKASGVSDSVKADLQTVAQEFETVRQMAKMCIGRQGNHFPILCKEYFHGSLRDMGTRENVIQAMAQIESIDAEAYCRQYKTQLNRIVPYVVLVPCYGDYGICWEPFDRYNRATGRGRVAIPMYPKNLTLAVVTAVADLRWQTAKEKASYYWMEEGLTGNYYQWYQSKKLKGDLKELFIADYILWLTKESDGVQKLDKEVRQIFWRYLPFTQAVKEKLKTRSYIYQELYQKDVNRSMSDGY